MLPTKKELAEELGVSPPRISQLSRKGCRFRVDGKIDLKVACRVGNLGPTDGDGGSSVYSNAREWLFLLRNERDDCDEA